MLAFQSQSYPFAPASQGSPDFYSSLATDFSSYITPIPAPPYDMRGRQAQYTESASQRRERVEFLRKREWARRVAEWIRETSARQDVLSFGRSGPLATPFGQDLDSPRLSSSSTSSLPLSRDSSDDDDEPYVIYSSSPSSSMSSLSDDTPVYQTSSIHNLHSGLNTQSYQTPPAVQKSHRRRRSGQRTPGRKSSLSSIYEVPEED
ncbi:hypothetical protein SERLA73DRAFT_176394 [Serpula lacrymans var. lacrymans S7.3]|uniref:Uncharacterized protein n=2 Tax=Serpula lacrymans var. lacrymans TaxID=341189 RepID=F8PMU3_SERL3|nr:uncharacterized protein SERLADRAFT_459247 [Serpula lacrymans var. lacrymans S7.9]EGO02925.1 hypothetical protein SERLA73DRAFT_176394 [Serpula lacrymans var. lacrymans S7.3]EGO28614.1 hypothetical protein SERLADRAFT_459247 [Serpula lacrymans var. lacrymans S7.9]